MLRLVDGREIVEKLDLPADEKQKLGKWAHDYSWWGGVGMYYGGNSKRLLESGWGWLFRRLDRWMHKGI